MDQQSHDGVRSPVSRKERAGVTRADEQTLGAPRSWGATAILNVGSSVSFSANFQCEGA